VHLRANGVILALCYPICAHDWLPVRADANAIKSGAAPAICVTWSRYFFFFGFFTSFFGLLSLATFVILPYS
jgi:hypothetical protein